MSYNLPIAGLINRRKMTVPTAPILF